MNVDTARYRAGLHRLLLRGASAVGPAPVPAPVPEATPDETILDQYVASAPSARNAIEVFAGEWASQFPAPWEDLTGGVSNLFEDARITWALEVLGDIQGMRALELGPLEGGHSYMLARAGAEVTAVEASQRAYLKCLIAKEILGYSGATFLLGDFVELLQTTDERYDLCLASGVLYHMRDPVEVLGLIAKVAPRMILWTHYYDHELVQASDLLRPRFPTSSPHSSGGFEHTLHQFRYESALQLKGFCGGSAAYSEWLSREDLLGALDHFGWDVEIGSEDRDNPRGPCLTLVARQRHA